MAVKQKYIESIIKQERFFQILHDVLIQSENYDKKLTKKIFNYINEYTQFHELTNQHLIDAYFEFVRGYDRDVKHFKLTQKYPHETQNKIKIPSRKEYSVILLLSTILTEHRYRIMQLIDQLSGLKGSVALIGCGPGLEIELIKDQIKNITAYDLNADDFVGHYHKGVQMLEEEFDGSESEQFENIFLIEILEHLSDPYLLLEQAHKALKKEGYLFLTTATDIPQFDHLYNFPVDHINFDNKVKDMGFSIEEFCDIKHQMMTQDSCAQNRFYILKKQ